MTFQTYRTGTNPSRNILCGIRIILLATFTAFPSRRHNIVLISKPQNGRKPLANDEATEFQIRFDETKASVEQLRGETSRTSRCPQENIYDVAVEHLARNRARFDDALCHILTSAIHSAFLHSAGSHGARHASCMQETDDPLNSAVAAQKRRPDVEVIQLRRRILLLHVNRNSHPSDGECWAVVVDQQRGQSPTRALFAVRKSEWVSNV